MDQINTFADDRLLNGCIYCAGADDTRDHVPSRVLLDPPFPENLPVVGSCYSCNQGFSSDEEYLACLIESVLAGSTEPGLIRRPRVAEILRRKPALRSRIEGARTVNGGSVSFRAEEDRVRNVVLKLARGHAAYELSQPCRDEPTTVWWGPLPLMTDEQRDSYEASWVDGLFGELGSRQSQRDLVMQVYLEGTNHDRQSLWLIAKDWIDVQQNRYRYLAADGGDQISIKFVIREYLACEVAWAYY